MTSPILPLVYLGARSTTTTATTASAQEVVTTKSAVDIIADAAVNRTDVTAQIETYAKALAPKVTLFPGTSSQEIGVDNADANFVTPDYYTSRDLDNIPLTQLGVPNGIATLDATGKIPAAQIPQLGSGYMRGPFGPTTVATFTGQTAMQTIATFNIGVQNIAAHPLCYATVLVDTDPGARPIVEMRMSNGAAAYGSQTLVAKGTGMSIFDGRQAVAVTPVSNSLSQADPAPWASTTNIVITMYVYTQNANVKMSVQAGGVASAAVFLMGTRD